MIRNGAIIACHQGFAWKPLFTKPLRTIIQLVTGRYSHLAIYLSDEIHDATGDGVKSLSIQDWIKGRSDNGMKFEYFNLVDTLTDEQIQNLKKFISNEKNKEYSAVMAMISAFDNSQIKLEQKNKTFCSYFCDKALQSIGLLPARGNGSQNDPNELIARLKKFGLIEQRISL